MKTKFILLSLLLVVVGFFVVLFFSVSNGPIMFASVEGMTCDEMLLTYEQCKEQNKEEPCKEYYVDKIIDCYGEEVLRDQLALINQTR